MEEIKRWELDSGEAVSVRTNLEPLHVCVVLETDYGFTDWPMLYSDGRMVMDYPERFSDAAKELAYNELRSLYSSVLTTQPAVL